jgi:phosphate transport system substrate-binding protein
MLKKVILAAAMATMMMGATAMASGSLSLGGSSSVYPLAQKLTTGYNSDTTHSSITFSVSSSDSGTGVTGAYNGTYNIGDASRDLTTAEVAEGLVATKICQDAVVLIVNPNVHVNLSNLTTAQIKAIYSGVDANNKAVVYWSDVQSGLPHTKIVVETREAGSGTLDFFTKTFTAPLATAIANNGSAAMKTAVANTPNAIGFISMGYVDNSTVYGLQLDGKDATVYNAQHGIYGAVRNFNMVTKGTPITGSNAQLFLSWVLGTQGQAIVSADGEVPLTTTNGLKATNNSVRPARSLRATR